MGTSHVVDDAEILSFPAHQAMGLATDLLSFLLLPGSIR